MSSRKVPDHFKVAFSFAGEQRDLVRAIANAVEEEIGAPNVFFDEWFEHYIAGHDADLKLQEVYGERCALVVVCISARYGGKPWTRAEHEAIRSRLMKARESGDDLGILPIRVAEGEVEGILFNTIAPDVRCRSEAEAAKLIIDRLNLVLAGPEKNAPDWPEQPRTVPWPLADQTEVRVAFERLLTRTAPWRLLPLCGPSESGKSHITRLMLRATLEQTDFACGRFDLKGTTDMDSELLNFIQHLDVGVPPASPRLNERLSQVLDAIKRRKEPTLIILDTYEAASDKVKEWVERQLLPSLVRASWLRVVIAGQAVSGITGTIWESHASPSMTLRIPPPADWFEYGRKFRPEVTMEFVETACSLTNKATVLAQLLGPET